MENAEQSTESAAFMKRACDLNNYSACVKVGSEVTSLDIASLTQNCNSGTISACGLLVGHYSKQEAVEAAAGPLRKACDLGQKAACKMTIYLKSEPPELKQLLKPAS